MSKHELQQAVTDAGSGAAMQMFRDKTTAGLRENTQTIAAVASGATLDETGKTVIADAALAGFRRDGCAPCAVLITAATGALRWAHTKAAYDAGEYALLEEGASEWFPVVLGQTYHLGADDTSVTIRYSMWGA